VPACLTHKSLSIVYAFFLYLFFFSSIYLKLLPEIDMWVRLGQEPYVVDEKGSWAENVQEFFRKIIKDLIKLVRLHNT
jgi:hypothetical protein